jgi:3'-5' exoribonuclease
MNQAATAQPKPGAHAPGDWFRDWSLAPGVRLGLHDRGMEAKVAIQAGERVHPAIAELRPGRRFEGLYACLRKDRLTARNGGAYLSLELGDRTGRLVARVFREADRIGLRFERGDAVRARGKLERFRGELAAELDDVRRLEPGSFDPAEFLPAAYRSVEELDGFLEHLCREIHDPRLRGVVERLVFAEPLAADFRRAPCTRRGHHAYLGGLLEHTVSVGTLVFEVCRLHPRLDSDLLMAAALVHDIGKAREFTYGAEFGISDEGRLLGHLAIGAQMVAGAAGELPAERRLALLHCVLSHHGADAGPGGARQGAGPGGRGFASAEALALYRLNAVDASVKGALEQGLG